MNKRIASVSRLMKKNSMAAMNFDMITSNPFINNEKL